MAVQVLDSRTRQDQLIAMPVPEPTELAMLLAGLRLIGSVARRRARAVSVALSPHGSIKRERIALPFHFCIVSEHLGEFSFRATPWHPWYRTGIHANENATGISGPARCRNDAP